MLANNHDTDRTTGNTTLSPSQLVSDAQSISSSTSILLDRVDDNLLSNIISYVGMNQYRFIASINKRFQKIYMETFPGNKSTYWNITTMAHTRICAEEISPQRNERLCEFAAKYGNLQALQYFRSFDFSWNEWTCKYAARNGHLEMLQWCRQNGCPWDEKTCRYAAQHGHLEVLQWCRQNGCPWDEQTCRYAAQNRYFDVCHWCVHNGCPWDRSPFWLVDEYVRWCEENGYTPTL